MKLYNTRTRKKELFTPIKKGEVGIYSCGPTVYHYAHIGNLRTFIFADVLQRTLEYNGYAVHRVMNITDVGHLTGDDDAGEDKLEKEAKKGDRSVWDVAAVYTDAFLRDLDRLNIVRPERLIKATDTIEEQQALIELLIEKGHAYETTQAVYFDVSTFKNYGKLSGQQLDQKLTGARAEVIEDADKRASADFALWFKLVGKHEHHTMHWPSPWGDGFPGWHIECSAISTTQLGQPFDIHTGAIDLIGTHHENEIAQSEAAFGSPLAHVWMHGEFLVMDKIKMSKSKGNILTLDGLIEKGFSPLAYRYLTLTTHYRSPLLFSWDNVKAAQHAYANVIGHTAVFVGAPVSKKGSAPYLKKFLTSISDDLDMPRALALLWEALKDKTLSLGAKRTIVAAMDSVFGLNIIAAAQKASDIPEEIIARAKARWSAKEMHDFPTADAIRDELLQKGYTIEDSDETYIVKKVE